MSIVTSCRKLRHLLLQGAKEYAKCITCVRSYGHHSNSQESQKCEAAFLKSFNEPLSIENNNVPSKLKSDEVLIDVNYCALNGPDVLLSENLHNNEVKLPMTPGYEICGKLVNIGKDAEKIGLKPGDKVVAYNKDTFGGLSDLCISKIENVWKVPSTVKSIDAVCLLENYMTALIGLELYGTLAEDDIVLVNVGIGGFGLAAVDIASNVFRANVIGVGSSEERADRIRERGAYHAFTYSEKKLLKKIQEIAAERGITDVFEDESGAHLKKVLNSFMNIYTAQSLSKSLLRDDNFGVVLQHLSQKDRFLIAGAIDLDTKDQKDDKFKVNGISVKDYKKQKPEIYRQMGDDVISFMEEGLIKPDPSMVVGLYNVNEAIKFISDMKAIGKVIVDIKNKNAKADVKI